ncbi:L-serine ammonia-lyase [Pleomorphovibrio marinus]|uniref:L-serine ammonia-lyase n=1 Tax=Pleomorphovibrio marinus TaxID=2164132 RepID=UPI000E0CBA4A|nr:L-serine ammonia-lyase [Pleomorphovibrio marinus]
MAGISVFDMLKVGVGPSSSHTLGPWKACQRFLDELNPSLLQSVKKVKIVLYGSLSLTGKGHATDKAVMLGLSGTDPVTLPIHAITKLISKIKEEKQLILGGKHPIPFDPLIDIVFEKESLDYHANGLRVMAWVGNEEISATYYSIGGGFVQKEGETVAPGLDAGIFPFPIERANQILAYCNKEGKKISDIVLMNELAIRRPKDLGDGLEKIWQVMLESMYKGCHSEGYLPGGLEVKRRAFDLHERLMPQKTYVDAPTWLGAIRNTSVQFREVLKWVSSFALAVNEENAAMGRVVTAPTNGSAGVVPAVLMYYLTIENHQAGMEQIREYLMVASEIGSLFKKGATISAAMGGCQAEIGVSSAMAAAGLCELMGGTPGQVLIAAEIAMEHHLGLTCDPIRGLVQVPCIERNTMGAIKAISAAELALETDEKHTKVSLDNVIQTMWETAKDMNGKYKETSTGGLALTVNWVDC